MDAESAAIRPRPTWTITTSWDDGHPTDEKLCEFLLEHEIAATFYIPRTSQRDVMSESAIRRLSECFEVGAHTLDHLTLPSLPEEEARRQIMDSKRWLEDVIGKPCNMFCPPLGHFTKTHHHMIQEAGFDGYRTVEMLSIDRPRSDNGIWVMPTTLQAHPHVRSAYFKNALKRRSIPAIGRAMTYQAGDRWPENLGRLLNQSHQSQGVFHLWGHSWEIQSRGQWDQLAKALRHIKQAIQERGAQSVTNGQLCRPCASE